MFTAALFIVAKTRKQPKCPSVGEWIKQMRYTYNNGILFSHKKKDVIPFATTWMDLEDIILSEISQTEKDKYHMITFKCGI